MGHKYLSEARGGVARRSEVLWQRLPGVVGRRSCERAHGVAQDEVCVWPSTREQRGPAHAARGRLDVCLGEYGSARCEPVQVRQLDLRVAEEGLQNPRKGAGARKSEGKGWWDERDTGIDVNYADRETETERQRDRETGRQRERERERERANKERARPREFFTPAGRRSSTPSISTFIRGAWPRHATATSAATDPTMTKF